MNAVSNNTKNAISIPDVCMIVAAISFVIWVACLAIEPTGSFGSFIEFVSGLAFVAMTGFLVGIVIIPKPERQTEAQG